MIEISGNLFDDNNNLDCLVCTTNQIVKSNGELVMGAGIAKQFRDKYVDLAKDWGSRTSFKESGILITSIIDSSKIKYLCGLPTKYDWKNKSDINLIIKSCSQLLLVVEVFNFKKIGMTKLGCGNGGLNWADVKEKINFLDDRFIIYVQ